MKIFNLKKHICILLGIILLVSSTQIFSQEEKAISGIVSSQEIEELSVLAKDIQRIYKKTLKNISSNSSFIDYINSGNAINSYAYEAPINNSYKLYYEQLNELTSEVQLFQNTMKKTYAKYIDTMPEGTYQKKVTANYIKARMNTLFQTQNYYLDNLLSISDIIAEHPSIEDLSVIIKPVYFHSRESRDEYLKTQYRKKSKVRNEFIHDLADNQAYYQKAFTEDIDKLISQLEKAESSFSRETIEFFSKKEHTAEEILRYFETRLPENQKAILFALKVSDDGLTIKHLIPHIRYYLKQTNRRLWKLDKFSAEKLTTMLSKMSLAERTNFIDDLLDFTPETKMARYEIKQAEKTAGKKLIERSRIKLSGTFMAIGALLVASTIVEVNADNNFSKSIGVSDLAKIKHKIDNGQLLSLQEMSAYYTDERNLAEVNKNPLGLFEVFEIAITINDCLDQLNVEKSPHNPAKQQKQVYKTFDKYLEKVDLDKVTSQVGTI